MRKPVEHVAGDGTKTYKVRYRRAGVQTSETFRRKADAQTFAAVLDGGGVTDALAWLDARDRKATALTFGEWLPMYVDQLTGVTVRTREDHHNQARRYLGSLELLPLPMISRAHVTAIVNEMDARGLSAKTIENAIHMLSSVFALAVDEGHMGANPCRRVRLPKASLDVVEARFLTGPEFAALLAEIPDHYRPLVLFLVGTGLRWSEATALQSRHVDLARGTVRVEQAWKHQGKGRGYAIGVPKSAKSRRTVNAAVLALLAAAPLLGKPSDLVFTTPTGKPIRHNNFWGRVWRPACLAAGLDPAPRIHDLRHTHASWLISDGVALEAVQDQLGHESILTTRKVYGQLLPAVGVAVGRAASAALEEALASGNAPELGLLALEAGKAPHEGEGP